MLARLPLPPPPPTLTPAAAEADGGANPFVLSGNDVTVSLEDEITECLLLALALPRCPAREGGTGRPAADDLPAVDMLADGGGGGGGAEAEGRSGGGGCVAGPSCGEYILEYEPPAAGPDVGIESGGRCICSHCRSTDSSEFNILEAARRSCSSSLLKAVHVHGWLTST